MFGKFVHRLRDFGAIASILILSGPVVAQVRATVTTANAAIYRSPDFSSQVLGRVKAGTQWEISPKPFGLFYQIKIRSGLTGYIAESDLSPVNRPKQKPAAPAQASAAKKRVDPEKDKSYLLAKLPFKMTDFWGISFGMIRFKEDTMGMHPTDQLLMLGLSMSGPNIVLSGYPTEFNFQISTGAPSYYSKATGNPADGFLLMTNFLMLYNYPSGRNVMSFFGFGPMYKYSKFGVALNYDNQVLNYSLEDMALGAVFNGGMTYRVNTFALRLELTYYWEKQQYYGMGLSTQFAF